MRFAVLEKQLKTLLVNMLAELLRSAWVTNYPWHDHRGNTGEWSSQYSWLNYQLLHTQVRNPSYLPSCMAGSLWLLLKSRLKTAIWLGPVVMTLGIKAWWKMKEMCGCTGQLQLTDDVTVVHLLYVELIFWHMILYISNIHGFGTSWPDCVKGTTRSYTLECCRHSNMNLYNGRTVALCTRMLGLCVQMFTPLKSLHKPFVIPPWWSWTGR